MEFYLPLKLVHILSATLLFGTGLGTAFYMWRADRTKDMAVIASVSKNVVLADWIFTTPAVIIQPLSGLALAHLAGIPLSTSWVVVSLVLFVLVGLCWLPVVWLQSQVAKGSQAACQSGVAPQYPHRRYMRWWYALGWPAFLGVIGIFYMMVVRPSFW